jgi:hypothetical protein
MVQEVFVEAEVVPHNGDGGPDEGDNQDEGETRCICGQNTGMPSQNFSDNN